MINLQYSLRMMLVTSLLVAGVIGWYILKRQGEMGVPIRVPQPLGVGDGIVVPKSIVEFSSHYKFREHVASYEAAQNSRLESRLAKIKLDLSKFSPVLFTDSQLLKENKELLVGLANEQLGLDHSFETVLAAARLLEAAGEGNGYGVVEDRFVADLPQDAGSRILFLQQFDHDRLMENVEIVSELKSRAEEDSRFGVRAAKTLFDSEMDKQPYVRLHNRRLKTDRSDSALKWLIDNAPTEETLLIAELRIKQAVAANKGCALLAGAVLEAAKANPEYREIANDVERSVGKFLLLDENEYYKTNRHWQLLVDHGTKVSVEVLREVFKSARYRRHWPTALQIMKRIGLNGEAKESAVRLADDKLTTIEFLDALQDVCGQEVCAERCFALGDEHGNLDAIRKLSQLLAGTSDTRAVSLIRDKVFKDGNVHEIEEAILMLEKVGDQNLGELNSQIAESKLATDGVLYFFRHWHVNRIKRQKLVDWINKELKPATPLTIERVLSHPRYLEDHELWNGWSTLYPEVTDNYRFAVMALAHSGHGNFGYGEVVHPQRRFHS